MRLLELLLALALATALYAGLQQLFAQVLPWLDPFLIVVLYLSQQRRVGWSQLDGCCAGLVCDAMTGGLFGLHGIANTLVGFAAARLQQRLVIQRAFQFALVAALGAALQHLLLAVLQFAFLASGEQPHPLETAGAMISTGLASMALFVLVQRGQAWRQSKRDRHRRPTLEAR